MREDPASSAAAKDTNEIESGCLVSQNGIGDDVHIPVFPCNQNCAFRRERFVDKRLLLAFKIGAIELGLDQFGKRQ